MNYKFFHDSLINKIVKKLEIIVKITKKNYKNFKPQSLFLGRISMVILVIGILIAGISQGIDLCDDYRLASTRNFTKNSQVNRIPDLEMGLENTSENSLATALQPSPTSQIPSIKI